MKPSGAPVAEQVTVRVAQTRGSVPREVGATMRVFPDAISGTIGGGALEWEAIRVARSMMGETPKTRTRTRTFALGPDMGQCCGGAMTLEFTTDVSEVEPIDQPITIWGAGHVGRATAETLAPFETFTITLVDDDAARFPARKHTRILPLVATDMPRAVAHMPKDANHFILTYSHDIDLAICDALLRHDFTSCGLIGSATKWARFRKRLGQMGHPDAQISRILCPIGDPSLGKHPQAIAIGVAARLLGEQLLQESAHAPTSGGT